MKPTRALLFATRSTAAQELDRLELVGFITVVNDAPLTAPIVAVKKASGKIRVCAGLATCLKAALDDHQYQVPVPADIPANLYVGKRIAKVERSGAYLQLRVDDQRSPLDIPIQVLALRSKSGARHFPTFARYHEIFGLSS
ncbi:unnamed protein product [Dicrocoelium dendriticum]|nr:unnamed protein product [Dicrocoelium dendriticum]